MKQTLITFIACVGLFAFMTYSNDKELLTYAQKYQHHSNLLNEQRSYSVHLPADYDASSQKRYPVIYVLDADKHLLKVVGIVNSLREGLNPFIPAVIVVGVHNTNRMRDFTPSHTLIWPNGEKAGANYKETGGGLAFLNYLEQELKPHIDQQYKSAKTNLLIGHSLGGLLALEAINQRSKMFQGYISIDPSLWFDYPTHFSAFKDSFSKGFDKPTSLYLSIANNPYTPSLGRSYFHRDTLIEFAESINNKHAKPLYINSVYAEHEDHHSVYDNAAKEGLKWLFKGYALDFSENALNADEVIKNYQHLNARLHADLKPEKPYLQKLLKKAKRWPQMGIPAEEISRLIRAYDADEQN